MSERWQSIALAPQTFTPELANFSFNMLNDIMKDDLKENNLSLIEIVRFFFEEGRFGVIYKVEAL